MSRGQVSLPRHRKDGAAEASRGGRSGGSSRSPLRSTARTKEHPPSGAGQWRGRRRMSAAEQLIVEPKWPERAAAPHEMRAITIREFGGPDVLKMEALPTPEPGPGELLVRRCRHQRRRRSRCGGKGRSPPVRRLPFPPRARRGMRRHGGGLAGTTMGVGWSASTSRSSPWSSPPRSTPRCPTCRRVSS